MQLRKLIIPGLMATFLSVPVMAQGPVETQLTGATITKVALMNAGQDVLALRKQQQQQQQQQQQTKTGQMYSSKGTLLPLSDDQGFLV